MVPREELTIADYCDFVIGDLPSRRIKNRKITNHQLQITNPSVVRRSGRYSAIVLCWLEDARNTRSTEYGTRRCG